MLQTLETQFTKIYAHRNLSQEDPEHSASLAKSGNKDGGAMRTTGEIDGPWVIED